MQIEPDEDHSFLYFSLGLLNFELSDFKEAEKMYLKALSLYMKRVPESIEVVRSLDALGALYYRIGFHSKSINFHNKAGKIMDNLKKHYFFCTSVKNAIFCFFSCLINNLLTYLPVTNK